MTVTAEQLKEYADAWNNHDIEAIMSFMTEDCIFDTGSGQEIFGTRIQGFETVKLRFIDVWESIPDAQFIDDQHFAEGNRGCSHWTFIGTTREGTLLKMNGCDLFTFREDKIFIKDSYLKSIKS